MPPFGCFDEIQDINMKYLDEVMEAFKLTNSNCLFTWDSILAAKGNKMPEKKKLTLDDVKIGDTLKFDLNKVDNKTDWRHIPETFEVQGICKNYWCYSGMCAYKDDVVLVNICNHIYPCPIRFLEKVIIDVDPVMPAKSRVAKYNEQHKPDCKCAGCKYKEKYSDVFVSPEAAEELRNWGINETESYILIGHKKLWLNSVQEEDYACFTIPGKLPESHINLNVCNGDCSCFKCSCQKNPGKIDQLYCIADPYEKDEELVLIPQVGEIYNVVPNNEMETWDIKPPGAITVTKVVENTDVYLHSGITPFKASICYYKYTYDNGNQDERWVYSNCLRPTWHGQKTYAKFAKPKPNDWFAAHNAIPESVAVGLDNQINASRKERLDNIKLANEKFVVGLKFFDLNTLSENERKSLLLNGFDDAKKEIGVNMITNEAEDKLCSCDTISLMQKGCTCGGK